MDEHPRWFFLWIEAVIKINFLPEPAFTKHPAFTHQPQVHTCCFAWGEV